MWENDKYITTENGRHTHTHTHTDREGERERERESSTFVVDQAEHRSLVAELLALRAACDESAARQAGPQAGPPGRASGAKRFEMWVSLQVGKKGRGAYLAFVRSPQRVLLQVGLPEEAEQPPAFTGTQVFSARSAVLRRAGVMNGTTHHSFREW